MLIFRLEVDHMSFCQAWCAASQRADIGQVSDGSRRSNFFGLGHLIISGAEFPLLPPGTTHPVCQRAHLSPLSVTSVSSSSLNNTSYPPPFTFCSLLVLQDSFLSLSCQETVVARLTSRRGDMLLFNRKDQDFSIVMRSHLQISGCVFYGSWSHLLPEEKSFRAEMVS